MGILDEAIREHLELKRRHGAAEPELKQIEDEAFGPAPRPDELEEPQMTEAEAEAPTAYMPAPEVDAATEATAAPPAPEATSEPPPPEPGPVEEEHPAMEHEAVSEAPPPEAAPEVVDQPTEHYDVAGEVAAEPEEAEPPADTDEEAAEFFDEQSLSEELDQALDAPPAAHDVPETTPLPEEQPPAEEPQEPPPPVEEPPAEPEGEAYEPDEDVLEETPEFLQDTPEHDRLWFEQKPPKDFDFDD